MPQIVEHIILVTGVIGVAVILRGVLLDVLRLVRLEWASLSGRDTLVEREDRAASPQVARRRRRTPASPSKLRRDDDARREEAPASLAERSR